MKIRKLINFNYNINQFIIKWWSFLKPERLIATNALFTPSTKSPNTKKEKKAKQLREEDVTTENSQVTEDKPNPSSERKPKPPKKSLLDYNVPSARQEDVSSSAEPRVSS